MSTNPAARANASRLVLMTAELEERDTRLAILRREIESRAIVQFWLGVVIFALVVIVVIGGFAAGVHYMENHR